MGMDVVDILKQSGHGHVVPRADGHKAECGGPKKCVVCKSEKTEVEARKKHSGAPECAEDTEAPS